MHDFYRHLTHLFCCVPLRRKADDHTAASLSTLQVPTSTLSIHLPHDTIPHGSSDSHTEDARALHHIFSSSSSVRGYQTAATTPGYVPTAKPSFDRDFQFGQESPSKRAQTPIEKLGRHIRQRFSESRLSKSSSKHDRDAPDVDLGQIKHSLPLKAEPDAALGQSHSTAGLADILAFRTASQGGYDSDAHTIASPLLRSNAGTLKVSAGYVKQALEQFDSGKNSAATAPEVRPTHGDSEPAPGSPHLLSHPRAKSSPFPSTPSKTTFTAALQLGTAESPSDVLRRLSAGIADGTIKAPDTPELRALRMPGDNEFGTDWRLAAPERTSSLQHLDHELDSKLKRLSDRFESAKRDSLLSGNGDDHRTSLISELDPALIDYMSKYADRRSSETTGGEQPGETKRTQVEDHPRPDMSPRPSYLAPAVPENGSKHDVQSLADSENNSVHLFNMRISQRLASRSQLPLQSPHSSNNASARSLALETTKNLDPRGKGSITHLARYPTRIAVEHNRRPSDPQTRKLFESDHRRGKINQETWKTITSVHSGSASFVPSVKFTHLRRDDASSFYWSDAEVGDSQLSSPVGGSRRNSLQNPHSFAVSGRSVSTGLSGGLNAANTSRPITADAPLWPRKSRDKSGKSGDSLLSDPDFVRRGRSVSMPQKQGSVQTSPTPLSRQLREGTDAAENISQISLNGLLDRRNENLTEVSAQDAWDKRDERFSEVEHYHVPGAFVGTPIQLNTDLSPPKHPRRSEIRRGSGNKSFGENSSADSFALKECGTAVWERAFRNARDDDLNEPPGKFLTAPQFNRDGRRRGSTRLSVSDGGSVVRRRDQSFSDEQLSLGPNTRRRSSASTDLDAHQHLCSIAKAPLPRAGPAINLIDPDITRYRSQTAREKTKPRKKSVLDLGSRFASGEATPGEPHSTSSTPLKDLLGIWGRFPSHTREERNGSAAIRDSVKIRDFLPASSADDIWQYPTPTNKSSSNHPPFASGAMKRLHKKTGKTLDKAKSKSMTLRARSSMMLSPAERAKKGRKGLLGKWRRLYRSSSTEMRKYARQYGHRSSLSVGDDPEYPELEVLPGEGMFKVTDVQRRQETDGSTQSEAFLEAAACLEPSNPPVAISDAPKKKRADAADWGRYYGECVGRMSALKSDDGDDVLSLSLSDRVKSGPSLKMGGVMSAEVRDSTSDFRRKLGVEQEKAREELIEKIGRIGNEDAEENGSPKEKPEMSTRQEAEVVG